MFMIKYIKLALLTMFILVNSQAYAYDSMNDNTLPKAAQITVSEFVALHEKQVVTYARNQKINNDSDSQKYGMLLIYIRGTTDAMAAYYALASAMEGNLDERKYNCINGKTGDIINEIYKDFKSGKISGNMTLLTALMKKYVICMSK